MSPRSGPGPELRALLLAALLSLCFLGAAVRPDHVLLPYRATCVSPWREQVSPEAREAARAEAVPHLGDKWMQCLPFTTLVQERWRALSPPVWTRRLFGGQMLCGDVVPQPFHPVQLLLLLGEPLGLLGGLFWLLQVLTGWWQFRFLRVLGLPELACHLGLVTWSCGLWVQARVHHPMVLTAACSLPLVLELIERVRLGQRRAPLPLLALAIGWAWLGGFTQSALMVTLLAGVYALAVVRTPRTLGWLTAAIGLGALLGAVQTLPALEAAQLSGRGFEPASVQRAVALQAPHLLGALVPNLLEPVREFTFDSIARSRESWPQLLLLDTAQGQRFNHTETAFAVGVAGLLLALLALGRRAVPRAWFFTGLLLLALLVALGAWPFLELVRAVPGAGVGDVKRWLYLVSFALSVLAAQGAARVLLDARRGLLAALALVLCGTGALLLAWLWRAGPDGVASWFGQRLAALYSARTGTRIEPDQFLAALAPGQSAWQYGVLRRVALLLTGAAGATAVGLLLPRRAGVALLVALSAAELLLQGQGRCVAVPRGDLLPPAPILDPVRAEGPDGARFQRLGGRDPNSFQATTLLPPGLPVLLGIADAGGYSVFTTRRLDQFWNAAEPGLASGGAVTSLVRPTSLQHPLLDRFGVRWILSDRAVALAGLVDATPPAAAGQGLWLYQRTTALPRAVLVHRAHVLPDETARLRFLAAGGYDPAQEVVLEAADQAPAAGVPDPDDRVELLPAPADDRTPVRVHSRHGGLLVLAEPWYPDCGVTIDGAAAPLLVADQALRAVRVPPGTHQVEFSVGALAFRRGAAVSLGALLAVLGLALLLCWRSA